MSLEIRNLSRVLAGEEVLADLNLNLEPGALGCLLGPSGCGKSTLLRCIAGLDPIQKGEIRVGSKLLSSGATKFSIPPEKRNIALVFQDFALFPHLNVEKNLGFGLHKFSRRERAQRVDDWAERLGLKTLLRRFPHELSGGEQQRVALGRAMVLQPDLVLLDEPFSSLDTQLRVRLALEVKNSLQDQKTTALLVTHDQEEAFAFADILALLVQGRIEQVGSPYDLYHRPSNRVVADLIGERSFIPAQWKSATTVETSLGLHQAHIPTGTGPSTELEFLVRPDDVLHDDNSPFRARIIGKLFRGASFLYKLELQDGTQIQALVPSHHNHQLGEWIGIKLELEHGVAMERRHKSAEIGAS